MSFSRPLSAARPQRQRERDAVLRKTREAVRARSNGCCQWPGCTRSGSDLAHGWGRGHIIGQPLCDHPTLCWWACRDHHDLYDGRTPASPADLAEEATLEWEMVVRAIGEFGLNGPDWLTVAHGITYEGRYAQPIDAVRWLERSLRNTGQIHGREWA
jgi:hypothetical protein